jgi:HEPN superfamily AbiU2-like protein
MKLQREECEQQFEKYRESLRLEIHPFRDSASVFRQISERTAHYLSEINLAPGFFHDVEDSLFTTIVLWADKLFNERGERGLFNFLTFVEYNCAWLTTDELKRRRGYPDGHWMLKDRIPIISRSIEADRLQIRSLAALRSIRIRRDKFHGHFDKEYFFDRSRLHSEAPITWLNEGGDVMGKMLNDYSVDFDGEMFSWKAPDDLGRLLKAAARKRNVHVD